MNDLTEFLDELKGFFRENKSSVLKWLAISAVATLALNLLLSLIPMLPVVLFLAVPFIGWQFVEWKRDKTNQ